MSRRVLIVDDNRALAENLAELLELEGFHTAVASQADEARRKAAQEEVDSAVLDVRLAETDGVALHAELSRLRPSARFILMTAYMTDARVADALRAGVHAVLPKPVPIERLVELLRA